MTEQERNQPGSDRATEAVHDDRPVLESRHHRLGAYLRHNGERICRDTAVLATWALVVMIWIRGAGVPPWACYVITFMGVVGYTQVTPPWSRPYTSFDEFESAGADERLLQESK